MEITINDLQRKIPLNLPEIKRTARAILKKEDINKVLLSIAFVTNKKIMSLNKKFLGRSYVTDVLAFDLTDCALSYKKNNKNKDKEIFGDIIISTDTVVSNSKEFDTTIGRELVLYLIHGILHLEGYDDHKGSDIKRMRRKELELLDAVKGRINKVINL